MLVFYAFPCYNCIGKGKVRQVQPDDPCFLTEKDSPWDGMLEDVLRQNDIPFLTEGRLGAGLSTYVGPILEVTRFYVRWSDLERAKALVEELFGADSEEST